MRQRPTFDEGHGCQTVGNAIVRERGTCARYRLDRLACETVLPWSGFFFSIGNFMANFRFLDDSSLGVINSLAEANSEFLQPTTRADTVNETA